MVNRRRARGWGRLLISLVVSIAFCGTAQAQDAPEPIDTPDKARAAQAHWAQKLGRPVEWRNSLGMVFRLVPPGSFLMGTSGETDAPPRVVTLTQPFYMGATEVTRAQYEALTQKQHSTFFPGPEQPINFITWYQATAFAAALSEKEELDAKAGYRLPSEAEWEFAARAGATTAFSAGDDAAALEQVGWYFANAGDTTHPVASKAANAFGLYDVHGNVWEWCDDFYDPDYYRYGDTTDPKGATLSLYRYRVLRGGSIYHDLKSCRSGHRAFYQDSRSEKHIGFRLVLPVSEKPPEAAP